jgi:hypothetical protein
VTTGRQIVSAFRRPAKLSLYLQIAAVALAVPLLSHLRLPRLATVLGRRRQAAALSQTRVDEVAASVAAVLRFLTPVMRPTCLTRGLVLYHFLRRAGVDVQLCFGAGYPAGEFAAHCWLIHEGKPFLEAQDPRLFTEFYRLAPSDADEVLLDRV